WVLTTMWTLFRPGNSPARSPARFRHVSIPWRGLSRSWARLINSRVRPQASTMGSPFQCGAGWLAEFTSAWHTPGRTRSTVVMVGSGRPVNARVIGDPNQDDNSGNDRLPGLGRNSLLSPNYASTDMRLTRRIYAGDRVKLELLAEFFNLLNRDNRRVNSTDDG